MKIASPNDTNPDCTPESGVTYGTANRYASSTGDNSGKVVDTFDGREGEKDEVNTNTSCATLSMSPNTYDSTYSDVTVYTNSGTGYAITVQSATGSTPALTDITDSTNTIPAGVLTEQDSTVTDETTGETTTTKIVPGGQNKWAYKTNNGIIKNWTAVTTSPVAIKSYDIPTSGGDTTRVTYGISAGNNPAGKYTTTLTYTATMFDSPNPYVSKLNVTASDNLTISADSLSIPYGQSAQVTATPAAGYYLSEVNCANGFTCSGYDIDMNNTSAQTITVSNNNTENTGTIALSATLADPWACPVATKDSPCVVNGKEYIRLADGHLWTKSSQGSTTWNSTLSGVSCPSGTSKPTAAIFQALVKAYGGADDGTYDGDPDLYNATGWYGGFWSTTEYSNRNAWYVYVSSASTSVSYFNKTGSYQVTCYH